MNKVMPGHTTADSGADNLSVKPGISGVDGILFDQKVKIFRRPSPDHRNFVLSLRHIKKSGGVPAIESNIIVDGLTVQGNKNLDILLRFPFFRKTF